MVASVLTTVLWVLSSAALGVLSRVEEVTPGFSAGISSNGAWCAAAVGLGLLGGAAARRGVVGLTIANASYYAVAGLTPRAPMWFVLGVGAGVVFGWLGARLRAGAWWALLPLALVLVHEGADRPRTGDRIELVLGVLVASVAGLAGTLRAGRRPLPSGR